ncbi:unnamed protein product [Penicillium salamii]|uniref:Subtilisin-like serine protease n=1 Tax=Penicillium salamii TaxID=1612424 RepID=A0A9W4K4E2_9EURO|nr:unnamed protein product [Penicillium salamii]CAG8291606.1 unnamed protein product [Penicillium salamii]CAG8315147.1 unnamed protein product [Penicillium salamii]CAG8351102.1 unnamed protein product [Penicillium salamii]CAG8428556.1 unnamed protein product [Penicillium salamii]
MSTQAETSSLPCPFHKHDQLNGDLDASLDHLPGHPRIKMSDHKGVFDFILQEVWSEDLESISGRLWWMSKQDSSNISPLHRQRVKGRQIIITEDPRLHLVWIDDQIFLKPLPQHITSSVFWDTFMSDPSKSGAAVKLRKAALGYLRTYFYLIQYESDLRIAQDPALCLVPKEVTWPRFCQFTARFNDITDNEVSGRYHYGEIRLSRLNYYAPVLLGKSQYQRVNHQYRAYFARIQGPVISVFAFFSILLNCMQVNLAASDSDGRYSSALLFACCYWLSTLIGCVTGVLLLMLVFLFLFKVIREWKFAIAHRLLQGKDPQRRPEGHV